MTLKLIIIQREYHQGHAANKVGETQGTVLKGMHVEVLSSKLKGLS